MLEKNYFLRLYKTLNPPPPPLYAILHIWLDLSPSPLYIRTMLITPNQTKNHCQRLILHQPFEETVPNSILFTAVPKPEIDFVREIVTEWAGETDGD